MKQKQARIFAVTYLQITAVITASIGLVLLFWPEQILQWFIPGATGDFFIRFIGSALLGFSTLNFLASKSGDIRVYQIALDANLVTLSVATALSIVGTINGSVQSYQWLLIGEHVMFVSLFAWARSVNRRTSRN